MAAAPFGTRPRVLRQPRAVGSRRHVTTRGVERPSADGRRRAEDSVAAPGLADEEGSFSAGEPGVVR